MFCLSAKVLQFLYSQKEKLPLVLNLIRDSSHTESIAYIERLGFSRLIMKNRNILLIDQYFCFALFLELQENLGSFSVSFLLPREKNRGTVNFYQREELLFFHQREY